MAIGAGFGVAGLMALDPHLTSPAAGEGLFKGRMGSGVQPENRRVISPSPRMGEAAAHGGGIGRAGRGESVDGVPTFREGLIRPFPPPLPAETRPQTSKFHHWERRGCP